MPRAPVLHLTPISYELAGADLPTDLTALIPLMSDLYWEQDVNFRFTHISAHLGHFEIDTFIGRSLWEIGATPTESNGDWDPLKIRMAAHLPIFQFVTQDIDPFTGDLRYFSYNGIPKWTSDGSFDGYRGVITDVTSTIRDQHLLKLEHEITACLDRPLSEIISNVLHHFCVSQAWACGAFWRLHDDKSPELVDIRMRVTSGLDLKPHFLSQRLLQLSEPAGVFEQLRQTQTSLWVADIKNELNGSLYTGALGIDLQGALFCPVVMKGVVVGVFDFACTHPRVKDLRLLATISGIAVQIAQLMQREKTERFLRESEARFRSLVLLTSDWYWRVDARGRVMETEGVETELGNTTNRKSFFEGSYETEFVSCTKEDYLALMAARAPFRDVLARFRFANKSVLHVALSGEPVFSEEGEFQGYRGLARDVTERRRDEEKIEYMANHDSLTALPNRTYFGSILRQAIHTSTRNSTEFAVLFIDLDRFKTINDTLGHEAGDQLLQEMARRLQHSVRVGDTVARLGGDEFVVLLPDIQRIDDIAKVARKIMAALIQSVFIRGQECRVTGSLGISRFPEDSSDEHELLKNADIAMYRAKEQGKNNYQFYSDSIKAHSLERLALETSLRRALEREEFRLHYQAKLDLKTGKISGVEALLRWQHPDLGVVAPAQFIPLAEETGLIVQIGRWVVETACSQNRAWQAAGLTPVRMAVNLSARQFADDGLVQVIANALTNSELDPQWLELDLTESMVMHDHERAIRMLTDIKSMGVRLAIDDFGVGYSSLAQIKRFPIDTLKVDRSFIRDLPGNAEDCAITQAIIAMGRTLSMTVVAEGVETLEQESFLRDNSCDETQGFYFSRPVEPAEFAALLQKQ